MQYFSLLLIKITSYSKGQLSIYTINILLYKSRLMQKFSLSSENYGVSFKKDKSNKFFGPILVDRIIDVTQLIEYFYWIL